MGPHPEREKPSISGAPAQIFTRNPNNAQADRGEGDSSFVCRQKSPESHQNPTVFLFESDDKRMSGAFSAANTGPLVEARAGGGGEMSLAAINFQLRRRGTKQSSSPLRRLFQFVLRLNARRLPTCFLKLIIGSGKLAYLRLALWLTEESHKHKQTGGGNALR